MADIKRLNYFNYQFLVDRDFEDEQAYHLQMRRRHNRQMHTPGVADGLTVTKVAANQVRISPGTAIDPDGREIVLEDARVYTLVTGGNNVDVFLVISYQDSPIRPTATHRAASMTSRASPSGPGSKTRAARRRPTARCCCWRAFA